MLGQSHLHDVELKGSDGIVVTANKCVLSTSSLHFERAFKADNTKKEFDYQHYNSKVIGYSVGLMYSVAPKISPPEEDNVHSVRQWCKDLTSFSEALHFFGFRKALIPYGSILGKNPDSIENSLKKYLSAHPPIALIMIEACVDVGAPGGNNPTVGVAGTSERIDGNDMNLLDLLKSAAFELVKKQKIDVNDCSTGGYLTGLSPACINDIISNEEIDAYYRCQILQFWDQANKHNKSKEHLACKEEMAKKIPLEKIKPGLLEEKVGQSGLYSTEEIMYAYQAHALAMAHLLPRQHWEQTRAQRHEEQSAGKKRMRED